MAVCVLAATALLAASEAPPAARLAAGALTGAASFWLALGVERQPLLCEARRGFRSAWKPQPAAEGWGDAR
jgi:hypothetical protein